LFVAVDRQLLADSERSRFHFERPVIHALLPIRLG